MQRFWHIPVYPPPRPRTLSSPPTWDEHDTSERVMIRSNETFRTLLTLWGFTIFSLLGFALLVVFFGYVYT